MNILLNLNAQNSFLDELGTVYMGEKAEILKVRLRDFIPKFTGQVIYCKELHAPGDNFFVGEKTHSITTTPDTLIIKELKPFAKFILEKYRYNSFYKSKLDAHLDNVKPDKVTVVGVETHTSVLFTVEGLRNRGYEVEVVEACVMSGEDYMHDYAITLMRNNLGVDII